MKKRLFPHTEEENRKIKHFWNKDGHDYIAKLGKLDRAIVIRYFTPNFPFHTGSYYAIAHGSFLPFTNEQHDTRFDDPIECLEFAELIVLDWVQSLFVSEESNHSLTEEKALEIEN